MIIDAHTHIGFGGAITARAADLVASMRRAGIDMAAVFAGEMNECPTEAMLKAIAPHADALFGIGSVTPGSRTCPSPSQVDKWLASGAIRGLKFYPGYEFFYPYDAALRPYLDLLVKHRRPAIFHSGDTYSVVKRAKLKYALPIHVDELAVEMPTLKIVIAHLGYPWVTDAAEVLYKNKNVFADCSGFTYGPFKADQRAQFKGELSRFLDVSDAPDRVLFGSDWPISDQRSYVRAVGSLVPKKHRARFFAGGASELFGLAEKGYYRQV